MRSRKKLFSFVLCMIIAQVGHVVLAQSSDMPAREAGAARTHPGSFSFITNREPIINLDGMWRFHPGDDARWASPTFDDSAWPLLRSDEPWTKQGYSSPSGFAWYRFNVQAPSSSTPLALLLPSILTDYEVFENGKKIGGFGRLPPHGSLRFSQTLLYHLDPVPEGANVQFAIRVWHHPIFATYLGGGPRYAGARLGQEAEMEDQFRLLQGERLNRVASFFALGILNAVISATVFGLYFYRRTEREYLWFAVLLLSSASGEVLTISSFIWHFPLGASDFLAECFGAVGVAASLLFFSTVLEARRSWIWRLVLLVAVLDPFNVILYVLRYLTPAASTSLRVIFDLPIVIYIVVLLCGRALAGNRNARLLFAPTMLIYGTRILGGALLLAFQLGSHFPTLDSINQWNVVQRPFPMPLQAFVELIFIVALLAFLIRRFAASRAKEERYTADIEAARTLQSLLIPKTVPTIPNLEIGTAYYPAQEVGGDFYQILRLAGAMPNTQPETLIVLGDVAGKGLPAALTVSMLVGALGSLIETTCSPAEILAGLNRRLISRGAGFTTCLILRLSPSGKLILANAGHLAPYLNGEELVSPHELPLGLDPDMIFSEQQFQLVHGDRLTLLTDGIPEATNHGELFGFERTANLSSFPADTIAEAALRFGQADDITVISVVTTYA
ncbi:MAG: phosphoserine phosphatase RsbU/P [Acidobacteriaceae bacterium]|nr:phosphoserine phosphatase RsbU/P [Acidobacteriaceae bacterium]